MQPDSTEHCGDLSQASLAGFSYWGNFCYAAEALRRERQQPGSITNDALRDASAVYGAHIRHDEKVKLIYESAAQYDIPPSMVFNLLNNESLTSEIGILRDFDNFSCGTGSLNLNQWCKWGLTLSNKQRKNLGFPKHFSCGDDVDSTLVKPLFYRVAPFADTKSFGPYVLDPSRLGDLSEDDLNALLPQATDDLRKLTRSFVNHCGELRNGIPAAAYMLRSTFDDEVPPELKTRQVYASGESPNFAKSCQVPYSSKFYPFQIGWVLAYSIHNVGEEAVDILEHYYTDADGEVHYPENLTPQDLMHALYFGGKYDRAKNQVIIDDPEDSTKTKAIDWMWPCGAMVNIKNMLSHSLGYASPLHYEGDNRCDHAPDSSRDAYGGRARLEHQ